MHACASLKRFTKIYTATVFTSLINLFIHFDDISSLNVDRVIIYVSLECNQNINWGKDCSNMCTCNGGHCDHRDGTCRCPPGRIGHQCEQGMYVVLCWDICLNLATNNLKS